LLKRYKMPLIQRLSQEHTISQFRAAALMRYREASRLATAGDRLAAIYLGGYAAEMLLKAAYFRLAGWGQSTPITRADVRDAREYATKTLKLTWREQLHDLNGWAALLVEERKIRGKPYAFSFSRSLIAHVARVFLNWREWLRYWANRPYRGEVVVVLQGVHWLLGQYRFL
jgi:hypothetical protein